MRAHARTHARRRVFSRPRASSSPNNVLSRSPPPPRAPRQVHKLKSGKKEHEFVSCMADLEVFIELKAHGVPDDAQKLLLDARDGLLRNKVRSPFWRAKAAAGFMAVMAKVRLRLCVAVVCGECGVGARVAAAARLFRVSRARREAFAALATPAAPARSPRSAP